MKIDAKEMNCTFSKMDKQWLDKKAIKIMANCNCIHNIGSVNIFKLTNLYVAINKESLYMKFFDLEIEAIDHYLDQFKGTQEFKQQEIFNP